MTQAEPSQEVIDKAVDRAMARRGDMAPADQQKRADAIKAAGKQLAELGLRGLIAAFPQKFDVRFSTEYFGVISDDPMKVDMLTEGQFLILGEEFTGIAEKLGNERRNQQVKVKYGP